MVKTVILCGGRGSRLRPLTDLLPKPLISLNGKPFLRYLITSNILKGFHHFALCLGTRGDMIKEFLAQQKFGSEFEFSEAGFQFLEASYIDVAKNKRGQASLIAIKN